MFAALHLAQPISTMHQTVPQTKELGFFVMCINHARKCEVGHRVHAHNAAPRPTMHGGLHAAARTGSACCAALVRRERTVAIHRRTLRRARLEVRMNKRWEGESQQAPRDEQLLHKSSSQPPQRVLSNTR